MDIASVIFCGIGVVTLAGLLIWLIATVFHYTVYRFSYEKFKGKWAVVTGASAGIGAGMARALARRGINVVLIARSEDKLTFVAEECHAKGVETKVMKFDFANASRDDWASLLEQLRSLSPLILVNNVGVNVEMPTEFIDMALAEVERIVTVNISATNAMTSALLPGMLERGRGIILCLSSGGGPIAPAPLLAPYAGTKAYNDAFAIALNGELSKRGVNVHSLTPFFVESSMAKMRKSFTVPSPDQFAEAALRLVGSSPRLQPYWVHYAIGFAITLLPLSKQVSYVAGLHRNIRKRALRKKERIAKQN